ncbi:MAG: RNA methyltransferase [Chloroflexota bacterium]|nr:RNA methyltransferase [Chloroflexota bacterium]
MPLITSRANSTVKSIRALRMRKEREATGLFFVEGIRLVAEAVQLGAPVELLVTAPGLLGRHPFGQELVTAQRDAGAAVLEASDEVFASLSGKEGPQGLAAVVRQRWMHLDEIVPGAELAWVALEGVQDPGNLGSILRTGDAVGAGGVILLGSTTDPHDPTAVRASMGAIFGQRLVRADGDTLAAWSRRHGLQVVGTSDAATVAYTAVTYRRPMLLLMGSEREGLSPTLQALADDMVRIPMVGRGDSLNLAVATAVVLYEIFNQGLKTWD